MLEPTPEEQAVIDITKILGMVEEKAKESGMLYQHRDRVVMPDRFNRADIVIDGRTYRISVFQPGPDYRDYPESFKAALDRVNQRLDGEG